MYGSLGVFGRQWRQEFNSAGGAANLVINSGEGNIAIRAGRRILDDVAGFDDGRPELPLFNVRIGGFLMDLCLLAVVFLRVVRTTTAHCQ